MPEYPVQPSPDFVTTINEAMSLALGRRDEYLTPEHMLYGLSKNPVVIPIFQAAGIDLDALRVRLQAELQGFMPPVSAGRASRTPSPTPAFTAAVQKAGQFAFSAQRPQFDGRHLLLGLMETEQSPAVTILQQAGLSSLQIKTYIAHGRLAAENAGVDNEGNPSSSEKPLDQFGSNLNVRATQGKIDPLIGRGPELERTVQVLCRRSKNNPLLVGEPGVGKTAIAEGLALRIIEGRVPGVLASAVVYSLDMGAMVAGTKYRGDFENRMKGVLKQAQSDPNIILFIDEIHAVIGAGAAGGSAMDAGNLLKPALASGSLRLMGSTTFQEFREVFEKDRALARRFQKIDIGEPSANESVDILEGLRPHFEKHHEVSYEPDALRAAVELSIKYLTDRKLPDKAIDLIDEAGARQRIVPLIERKTVITRSEIEATVASIAGVPAEQVSTTDRAVLGELETGLKSVVFGQDKAIHALVSAIKLSRAGLRSEDKPIGSFLFAGPTGVGKTEVTRQLAKQLGVPLKRFDMSEYMESHSVARLIGAPPGYVGYNQGGLLTEALAKSPHCVLLLDEIEKAHPDVYNILLQVMDRGVLTDTNGREVNCRNVIVVMTTNAGAQQASRRSIGFTRQDHTSDAGEALRRVFSPEFRNRLDAIVAFGPLGIEEIRRVVNKNLEELNLQLLSRNVRLDVSEAVIDWLATKGFDPEMGARPMARLIQEALKQPLAEKMLFGDLVGGGTASVLLVDGAIVIESESSTAPAAVPEEVVEYPVHSISPGVHS